MTRSEVEQLFHEETFSPFVLTTKDGFALPVVRARDSLLGLRSLYIKHNDQVYQIPFHGIAHISEAGDSIG